MEHSLSLLSGNERIDCHPDPQVNQETCLRRGCVWAADHQLVGDKIKKNAIDQDEEGAPKCFYPKDYGYVMVGEPVKTSGRRIKGGKLGINSR